MDTLKSLAVVTLLGAVLYGVYVVASKPDKPLSPDVEAAEQLAEQPPLIDDGSRADLGLPDIQGPVSETPRRVDLAQSTPSGEASIYGSPSAPKTVVDPNLQRVAVDQPSPETTPVAPEATPSPATSSAYGSSSEGSSSRDAEIEAAKQRLKVYAFRQAWKTAQEQVGDNRYREALLALTPFYNDPAIDEQEREQLVGWLDALAAKVVYSADHLIEPPYVVSRHETLYSISEKYRVPYLLLKNINGVRDPEILIPGTKLKVVPGPFRAEVDLTRNEITVFVQNLYAGRFPFSRGDEPVRPGEYTVRSKDPKKSYFSSQGEVEAKDPRNPYGGIWMGLENEICIHGSPAEAYAGQRLGCIGLAPRDAEDLFAILSERDSKVVIRE